MDGEGSEERNGLIPQGDRRAQQARQTHAREKSEIGEVDLPSPPPDDPMSPSINMNPVQCPSKFPTNPVAQEKKTKGLHPQ
jgi:hypothetical protein